jgi:hypothetical protein
MTKKEYIPKQQAMTRWQSRRLIWFFVVLFGAPWAMIPLTNYMDRHPGSARMGNLWGAGLAVILLGCILWMVLTMRRVQREFGVRCRNCGKQIFNSQIAIATGNCGF